MDGLRGDAFFCSRSPMGQFSMVDSLATHAYAMGAHGMPTLDPWAIQRATHAYIMGDS